MKLFGVTPSVECYTSLIDACVKEGSLASLEQAFVEFNRMKAEGLKPTAVTYGCLLLACERKGETDRGIHSVPRGARTGCAANRRLPQNLGDYV